MMYDEVIKAIQATVKIIEKQIQDGQIYVCEKMFSEYSSSYAFTNENINGYMSKFNFQSKTNALSVLASGDHAFNLIYNGIYDIDTFDSNKLTEYFALGIKRAAILKYSYHEFLAFMFTIFAKKTSLDELTSLITDLMPFMEKKYVFYWQKVLSINYNLQKGKRTPLNLFRMLLVNTTPAKLNTLNNTYLITEENYNKLRGSLENANISFTCTDALTLDSVFNGEYDFILLSNIADYFHKSLGVKWGYEALKRETTKMQILLHDDGVLAIAYIMGYYYRHSFKSPLFLLSNLKESDITSEEILSFPKISNNIVSPIDKDGLLLERKKIF